MHIAFYLQNGFKMMTGYNCDVGEFGVCIDDIGKDDFVNKGKYTYINASNKVLIGFA